METNAKGLGWILLGILLALLSLSGGMYLPVIELPADLLKGLSLLCGIVGMSWLYLRDTARARGLDQQE